MRTSYATKAVLASPPGQRPAKGVRGCADPDFATAPQSLRGAVVKRETERGQNRVSLDAVRAEVGITPLEPTPPRPWSRRRAVCVPVKSAASKLSSNAFRAHLAEFGIVVVQGIRHVRELIERVFAEDILIFPPRCVRLFGRSSRSRWNSDYRSSRSKRNSLSGIGQATESGLLRRRWNPLSSVRINQEIQFHRTSRRA
jgi:hypothetical protein